MDREATVDTDLNDDGPFNNGNNRAHLYNYSGSNAAIITGPDGTPARSFTAGTSGSNTAVYQAFDNGAAGPPYASMAMGARVQQLTNPTTNANVIAWVAANGLNVVMVNTTPAGDVYATMRSNTNVFYDTAHVTLFPDPGWWAVGALWDLSTNTLSLLTEGVQNGGRLSVAASVTLPPGEILYNSSDVNYFQIHSNTAFGKLDGVAKVWTSFVNPRVLQNGLQGHKGIKQRVASGTKRLTEVPRRGYTGVFQHPASKSASGYSLSAAAAQSSTVVRITVSVPVLHTDPANINDALNPHNYILTPGYIPAVSVTSITSSIFDVTFASPMAAINYNIKIIDVQTADGLNVAAGNDTKEFLGISQLQTALGTLNVTSSMTGALTHIQVPQRSVFCFEDQGSPSATLVPAELWLTQNRFSTPGLAQLQSVVMGAVTSSDLTAVQARTLLKIVYGSDLAAMFKDLVVVTPTALNVVLCKRQRTSDIDTSLRVLAPFYPSAYNELKALGTPTQYIVMLNAHLTSPYFQNRVAANCALVLLAAAIKASS